VSFVQFQQLFRGDGELVDEVVVEAVLLELVGLLQQPVVLLLHDLVVGILDVGDRT